VRRRRQQAGERRAADLDDGHDTVNVGAGDDDIDVHIRRRHR
jgi:hypothetical protein